MLLGETSETGEMEETREMRETRERGRGTATGAGYACGHRARGYGARARVRGQSTVITTEWWPLAPSGTVFARREVWTWPVPSVARTVREWLPGTACQDSDH